MARKCAYCGDEKAEGRTRYHTTRWGVTSLVWACIDCLTGQ